MKYLAVVRLNAKQEFGIELPDFPDSPEVDRSCASIDEVQSTAVKAVREAVAEVVREGEKPPTPTTKQYLESCPEYRSTFLVQVEVPERLTA